MIFNFDLLQGMHQYPDIWFLTILGGR